jgi:hypothetical protein
VQAVADFLGDGTQATDRSTASQEAAEAAILVQSASTQTAAAASQTPVLTLDQLVSMVGDIVFAETIDPTLPMEELGVDSIGISTLTQELTPYISPEMRAASDGITIDMMYRSSINELLAAITAGREMGVAASAAADQSTVATTASTAVPSLSAASPTLSTSEVIDDGTVGPLVHIRPPQRPSVGSQARTAVIVHTMFGGISPFKGLWVRGFQSHDVFGFAFVAADADALLATGTFETMKARGDRYARTLSEISSTVDLVAVSNGVSLAHQTALALREQGGQPGRLFLIDPTPPPPPSLPIGAPSMGIAARGYLWARLNEPPPDDVVQLLEQMAVSMLCAYIEGELRPVYGRGTPTVREIIRSLQAFRCLAPAEEAFYFENDDAPITQYVDVSGGAGIMLVLSEDEWKAEDVKETESAEDLGLFLQRFTQKLRKCLQVHGGDASECWTPGGLPLVRRLFGPVGVELVVGVTHLECSNQCTSGQSKEFVQAIADFVA